ncbi:hypothetical protein IE4872_PC00326 (plasmid) [Rhizobium gallicum]|uniref:Uncharacterized protein n=1 Tax=Rhizobium gallicum TaxID=56730 RepID=A0A1L5NR73_9HYPH|nr:hypothetical protein IE4872_PC00326 [Rhizobium gallicum]
MPSGEGGNHSIFQRNIKPDILVHGCLYPMFWAGSNREPVFPSYRGQPPPPAIYKNGLGRSRRDYPMFRDPINGRRLKKTIGALARKLPIALWKYLNAGVVIEGAIMKTA